MDQIVLDILVEGLSVIIINPHLLLTPSPLYHSVYFELSTSLVNKRVMMTLNRSHEIGT